MLRDCPVEVDLTVLAAFRDDENAVLTVLPEPTTESVD
jgi:hypothetical protein